MSATDGNGNIVQYAVCYVYSKNGNCIALRKRMPTETDALGQLIQARDEKGTRSYAYDASSNRTEKKESKKGSITYLYNENSQLTESTQGGKTTRCMYDVRGSLTGEKEEGKSVQSYVFDSAGRLAKVVGDADGDQSVTMRYAYDGFGNRIRKAVKRDGKTTAERHYTTDCTSAYGNRIRTKETVTGNMREFTYGDEVLAVAGGGKTEYYRTNEQQTVTETLDASGDVMAAYAYDEFFAYTGCLYDSSTGLYYAKDWYYDAEAGRFVSKDRCENDSSSQDSLNRCVYVGNNPKKYTDPSGKFAIPLYAAVGLVLLVYGTVYIISVNAGYLRTKEGKSCCYIQMTLSMGNQRIAWLIF